MGKLREEDVREWLVERGYNADGTDPRSPELPRPAPGDLITWRCPNGVFSWLPALRPEPDHRAPCHAVSYDAEHAAVLAALPGDGGRWLYLLACPYPYGMGWAWCADDDTDVRILSR